MRPFLFLSGESAVTAPLVYSNPKWDFIGQPTILVDSELSRNHIRRKNRPHEVISGCIHYCDVHDKSIEINNLKTIIKNNIRCWPDPHTLLRMIDRHNVLKECYDAGFIAHDIYQSAEYFGQINFPFVLKTGNEHRGLGKYLINNVKDIPKFDGIATMEPYFEGESVRVLIIGNDIFGIQTINDSNWIKNAPGGEILKYHLSNNIISHAKDLVKHFNLDIAGVDYIVNKNGFHFLEINQYPGIAGFDDIEECAKEFFKNKMKNIEGVLG